MLRVSGCAATAQLFCDRCVTCGTSPRGRIADLPMASFVAMGGDLERGCFNATVSLGPSPRDAVTSGRTAMTTPDLPATLLADLRDVQPPLLAGILIGASLAKVGPAVRGIGWRGGARRQRVPSEPAITGGMAGRPPGRHRVPAWVPPSCSRSGCAAR